MADPDLSDKRGRAGKRGVIRDPEIGTLRSEDGGCLRRRGEV